MSVPIGKICNKCGKTDICRNWVRRGQRLTLEEIRKSNDVVGNPALEGTIYKGDYVEECVNGRMIFWYVESVSCDIIDEYLNNENTVEEHYVIC